MTTSIKLQSNLIYWPPLLSNTVETALVTTSIKLVKPALVTTYLKLVKPALVTTSIKLVKPALVTTSIKLQLNLL